MKKIFSLFSVLMISFVFGQKVFRDLPKISEEDLSATKSAIDPDAPAEVLYRSMRHIISTEGNLESTYIERIKIYNKDKIEQSYLNPEISIYEITNVDRQKLSSLSAVTYHLDNGKIITDKVTKDSKFKSKEDKNYTITKFAFPNVQNGSVIEYKYVIFSPINFLWTMPRFMVELDIPQQYAEYYLDTPGYFGYNINYKGSLVPKARDTEKKNIYASEYQVYRFAYENIPAFKEENYVLNNDNYKTSIKAELNSTHIGTEFKSYSLSWEDIRKRLYEHENFGGELKRENLVKNILPEEIKSIPNREERANAILKFVEKNYTWNKEVDVVTDKGIKNLISTKIGNSAEINLLLIMLMRNAGLNANPVVLPTVGRGMLLDYSPTITQLNYVFACVENNGNFYYYDATSKIADVFELPRRALNDRGVLMTDKEAKVVAVFYPNKSQTFLTVDAKLNPDGTFSGAFSDRDTNLYANFVNEMYLDNKEDYKKIYKDKYKFALDSLNSGVKENGDFETTFNFNSDTFVDVIGNKLVFNPLLFLYSQNHDFNQSQPRRAPLQFFTANEKIKKVTITLPEGYVFENVPKLKKIRTEDSSIAYSYTPTVEGNKLTLETTTLIDGDSFPAEYYPAFKQIFDGITKLEGQVVTAVKK